MNVELRVEIGPKNTKLITTVESDEIIVKYIIQLKVKEWAEKTDGEILEHSNVQIQAVCVWGGGGW